MGALLSVSVVLTVCSSDEDCRITFGWIVEVQTTIRTKGLGADYLSSNKRLRLSCVKSGFSCKAASSYKESGRRQAEEITELASSHLRFIVALIWKLRLKRRGRRAD